MKMYATLDMVGTYEITVRSNNITKAENNAITQICNENFGQLGDLDYEIVGFYKKKEVYHFTFQVYTIYVLEFHAKVFEKNLESIIKNEAMKINSGKAKMTRFNIISITDDEGIEI